MGLIYDISVRIHNDMHVWPSDPKVRIEEHRHDGKDGSHTIRVTSIECGNHTGTHLDAPSHMMKHGARPGATLDEIPLERLVGPARVVELPGVSSIGRDDLEGKLDGGIERILLKTGNSEHWTDEGFYTDFAALAADGAEYLVESGVQLVGIDYLSIDSYGSIDHATHFVLLEQSVVILEGLNLEGVPAGDYQLIALPMKLDRTDGAPVRAILMN